MNHQNDYLIQTKGRSVCLVLDTAMGQLEEIDFGNEVSNVARDECLSDIFNTIVQVATISCGKDEWPEVYDFLMDIGVSVPSDFCLEMMYMESVSEKLPSEGRHN